MDHDAAPISRPLTTTAEPAAPPTEADLSRIAREAVHQPADPRLDRQLARLIGVMDPASDPAAQPAQPTARLSVVSGADLEPLQARLRRTEVVVAALVVAVVILAVLVMTLLVR